MGTWELELLHAIQAIRSPALDAVMVGISLAGSRATIWIAICAVLVALRSTFATGVTALAAVVASELAVAVLKVVFMRPRPFAVDPSVVLLIEPPGDWSFPSGHAAVAFACASAIAFSLGRDGWLVSLPVALLAALMAFSRLYLFVHWPTDVAAGMLLGMAVGVIAGCVSMALCKAMERKRAQG